MKSFPGDMVPTLVLPVALFIMLSYPSLEVRVQEKLPLLNAYDLSRQLASQIKWAESNGDGSPVNYLDILKQYDGVPENAELMKLKALSSSPANLLFFQELLAGFVLWRRGLPSDLLAVDPIDDIARRLDALRSKQKATNARWDEIVGNHVLECLRYRPPDPETTPRLRKGLPPSMEATGLVFCGEKIPLQRDDVRQRVEYQIDYLLTDLADTTCVWLKRKDRYGNVIKSILADEGMPEEFCLLPALESGYDGTRISPSKATGWWQFVKPTARSSHGQSKDMGWTLQVTSWRDDRRDLALSTRSAARYLKWIRSRLSGESSPVSWLLAAAAYNAGVTKVGYRTAAYNTRCFWDIKMPLETEDYVPRLVALHVIDANRDYYGIETDHIDPLDFDTIESIKLTKDLPLSIVAAATGCSVRFVREINPALQANEKSFRARGDGETLLHTIHVPKGCKDLVLKFLKSEAYLDNSA